MREDPATPHPIGSAFLLAQLGSYAAKRFADRVASLNLTPPLAGILRLLAHEPGVSQRRLADHLGAAPSRVVALVDQLEQRGLVSRSRSHHDRRVHELRLTPRGEELLGELSDLAHAHDDEVTAALGASERRQLRRLLAKLADVHELTPGVHPGYRDL